MKILIAGGGMAGLSLAPLLARQGHEVTVVERREQTRSSLEAGNSINLTLTPGGRQILEQLGLLDQVLALGTPLSHRETHLGEGRSLTQRYGESKSGWLLSVKRADLHAVFLEKVRACGIAVRFETTFLRREPGSGTAIVARHGEEERLPCELIVGADGVSSAVRRALAWREPTACRQEVFAWKYVNFPISSAGAEGLRLQARHLHLWSAEECLAVGIPNRDRSISAILLFRAPQTEEGQEAFVRAAERLAGRYPELAELLAPLLEEGAAPLGKFVEVSLDRWRGEGVVMVGDACHAMYPFCGLGFNTALEDVAELARELARQQPLALALERYEALRRPAATQAQAQSRAQFDFLYGLGTPASATAAAVD